MNSTFFTYLFLFAFSFQQNEKKIYTPKILASNVEISLEEKATLVYNHLDTKKFEMPQFQSFIEGFEGFNTLKEKGLFKKDILTIIDFSLPSSSKRLWVIDLITNTIIFNTFVSHGSGSGENYANSFSNKVNSNKSSLGFYQTAEVYQGKHGLSLKLDGLEKNTNSNARKRGIVVHGADYANASVLESQHYLGRSLGCPALPIVWSNQIINTIKGKSCLFIYHHPTRSNSKLNKSLLVTQSTI